MDLDSIIKRLETSENLGDLIEETAVHVTDEIIKNHIELLDLVRLLDPLLTNSNYTIRSKGVTLLTNVIVSLPKEKFTSQMISVLSEFLTLRLIDQKTMEHAALRGLSCFIDCPNKSPDFNETLVSLLKTKANVRRMEAKSRHLVYDMLRKIVNEKLKRGKNIDGELIYSIVAIMDGENNPENLIICFGTVSYILKNFDDLEPYIEEVFEWLGSYYPLDYTPSDDGDQEARIKIQRSDLVDALYDCFFVNHLNADCLFNIILEKLDSNLMSSKLESLNCLIRCYNEFPLDSVKKYNSTVWTAIRSSCLRKIETIDRKYLELSLTTLSSLARKMSEDREMHFNFLSDIYEELSIAFRKPEMDLFEPAAKLVAHVILPSIVGFNFVLDKILPVSLNAITANEFRPVPGLVYIFKKLSTHHRNEKLRPSIFKQIQNLAVSVSSLTGSNDSALELLSEIIRYRIEFDDEALGEIANTVYKAFCQSKSTHLEKCLALLCLNYKTLSLLGVESDTLNNLLSLIDNKSQGSEYTFRLYLRMLIMILNDMPRSDLQSLSTNQLEEFLSKARSISEDVYIVQMVAQIHAIVLNKLEDGNVDQIMMQFFRSDCCQKLISGSSEASAKIYLIIISWTFKSLVIRNHKLSAPLINLLLNFISSDHNNVEAAIFGARIFKFVLSEDDEMASIESLWSAEKDYKRFFLYKQKFYMNTIKEIKLRYEKESHTQKKQLLLCTLALQTSHLPISVYKRDLDWLIRELIRVMLITDTIDHENILELLYSCLTNLIRQDNSDQLSSFLPSLIDLNLKHTCCPQSLRVRKAALECLVNIAETMKHSALLVYRSAVIDQLQPCLSDKKRIVRQAAAAARLKWVLIGQPIG